MYNNHDVINDIMLIESCLKDGDVIIIWITSCHLIKSVAINGGIIIQGWFQGIWFMIHEHLYRSDHVDDNVVIG